MGEDVGNLVSSIREVLQDPSSPIFLRDGIWGVSKREELWRALGSRIFDSHLDALRQCAVEVLTERDPRFELPRRERYAAGVYGKSLEHSPELRRGLAVSLALLGSDPSPLRNCTQHKADDTAALAIREIFRNADWVVWGSLDGLLPILAEASPHEFLNAVERALRQNPCPFEELFAQEDSGIFGSNYLTGLLWALETLAWEEEHFSRSCVLLAKLAEVDPGGNWANRPANSLAGIYLPWLPQTTASAIKRQSVIGKLKDDFPRIAWKLFISLLPDQKQISFPTRKPEWRKAIPDSWQEGVNRGEYLKQVEFYAELTVKMAQKDLERCAELVGHLDRLPPIAFERFMQHLGSTDFSIIPEDQLLRIWNGLVALSNKHRRFPDADWSMSNERINRIEEVAAKLAPDNPSQLHRSLFAYGSVHVHSATNAWKSERKKLRERQQGAIQEVLTWGGPDAVSQLAEEVDDSGSVGEALGKIAGPPIDACILPTALEAESQKRAMFASGYVSGRFETSGWDWVDKLDRGCWSASQTGQFLCYLPFGQKTWDRVDNWLAELEGEYWSRTSSGFFRTEDDLSFAIDKYIEYGHPSAAIACLSRNIYEDRPLDSEQAIRVLLAAGESGKPVDSLEILEIIRSLQDDPETNRDDLLEVEWVFLPLFQDRTGSLSTLGNRLAMDPTFFCTAVRTLYLPEGASPRGREYSEAEKARATLIFRLLEDWQVVPGTQLDGTLSPEAFSEWLSQVKSISEESGHLRVALGHVGQVLIHGPPDDDGLWIHRAIASALEDENAGPMRDGFTRALYNSRGAHWVDPEGKPEKELAEKYREQAERVEIEGYVRLATALRRLAEGYDREAERIASEQEDLLDE